MSTGTGQVYDSGRCQTRQLASSAQPSRDPLIPTRIETDTPRMGNSRRPKGEGTIFQRADGRWVGRISYEDPVTRLVRQIQITRKTKTLVNTQLREIQNRVAQGASAKDDGGTFGVFASPMGGGAVRLRVRSRDPIGGLSSPAPARFPASDHCPWRPRGRRRALECDRFGGRSRNMTALREEGIDRAARLSGSLRFSGRP